MVSNGVSATYRAMAFDDHHKLNQWQRHSCFRLPVGTGDPQGVTYNLLFLGRDGQAHQCYQVLNQHNHLRLVNGLPGSSGNKGRNAPFDVSLNFASNSLQWSSQARQAQGFGNPCYIRSPWYVIFQWPLDPFWKRVRATSLADGPCRPQTSISRTQKNDPATTKIPPSGAPSSPEHQGKFTFHTLEWSTGND